MAERISLEIRSLIEEAITALEQGYTPNGLTRRLREAISLPAEPNSTTVKPLWEREHEPPPVVRGVTLPEMRISPSVSVGQPCCGQKL